MKNLYKKFRIIFCNAFGWHKPERIIYFNGIFKESKCRYCGKYICKYIDDKDKDEPWI